MRGREARYRRIPPQAILVENQTKPTEESLFFFFLVCNSQTCSLSLTQIFLLICSLFSCDQVIVDGCGKDRLESRSEVEDSQKGKRRLLMKRRMSSWIGNDSDIQFQI